MAPSAGKRPTSVWRDKRTQVVVFSSTAIALYGYDQGMMSLINTNASYLATMGVAEEDAMVGIIVSVYYLGCAVGAVLFSHLADGWGRKRSIFGSLAVASLGNGIMFVVGLGGMGHALGMMLLGRVVMGLGVGGVDSVIPTYSAELASDDSRGRALAQEFQMNIFGLVTAFAINLAVTRALGKSDQWAWRVPIVCMQLYPLALLAVVELLPESPSWLMHRGREQDARDALREIYRGEEAEAESKLDELKESQRQEEAEGEGGSGSVSVSVSVSVTYRDMLTPGHPQFHPTVITIMMQVNQALTGYGAVSVYGPQIFELLGFGVTTAEDLTMANYVSYFVLMTGTWVLIDAVGRRNLLLGGSLVLTAAFLALGLFGGLVSHSAEIGLEGRGRAVAVAVAGVVTLFIATGAFGVGWLAPVWLVPTEIFPTTARAQAAAVSVIVWALANFAVTLLTPIMFNNVGYYIFVVFGATNAVAGIWTYLYLPESGNRSFDENLDFFHHAAEGGTWRVSRVKDGEWASMPYNQVLLDGSAAAHEEEPLLDRVRQQLP